MTKSFPYDGVAFCLTKGNGWGMIGIERRIKLSPWDLKAVTMERS